MTKVCIGCQQDKPLSNFYFHEATGKHFARCMPCQSSQNLKRYYFKVRPLSLKNPPKPIKARGREALSA